MSAFHPASAPSVHGERCSPQGSHVFADVPRRRGGFRSLARRVRRNGTVVIAAALVCLVGGAARADVKTGQAALQKGQWEDAEKEFKASLELEKGPAYLGLAEVYQVTGRYPEAIQAATEASLVPATKARALCLAGEVFRETGKADDALKMFRAAMGADATSTPASLRARLYLGITLHDTGKAAEAQKTFTQFIQDFNNRKIDANRADHLTYTAVAAKYLQAWQDANDTFQEALDKDPEFQLANLEWGELFLAKYNAQEAAKCFQAVLKQNRSLPRALVDMARLQVETSYNTIAATRLSDEALKINPKYVPALNVKARLALDDEEFAQAEALLKQSLEVNPVDLEALALQGASRYLQDDPAGYEAARQKALAQNPRYSDFYFLVGELAVRHHRYAEGVQLNRQAVALDPKNTNALAALGANLLRLGLAHEAEGLKFVNQAFKLDGFNVRTFNTLNLYENVIAKEYETVPGPVFSLRLNKKERPLLSRYVPRLMASAWDNFVKKYGFTPKHPITVELFTERQHYGARTIGLPEFGAQGTCFGELITAMSPASAEADWEQVLWHELAHVFHLQLSQNRVPRWFTEGLAEYETNVTRPYWKREHGREIYLSLRRGDLWKISELSSAFTRPNRPNGVVIAYQQSSLVVHYLAETYGFPKLVEALKLYGKGQHDAEVLPAITGKPVEKLDEEFRGYLRRRFAYYEKGFFFDPGAYADGAKLKAEAEAKPKDAGAQAAYAAALLARQPMEAAAAARKALEIEPAEPLARYVLAEALLRTKEMEAAALEFERLLTEGVDGYPIRFALGRLAAMAGSVEAAAMHLNAAKKWDPDRGEPYAILMGLYEAKELRDELLKETEAYLEVQEHDHDSARLLIDRFSIDGRWEDIVRVAPRVLGITPMESYVHHQYGLALAKLKRPREAIFELESALIGGVRKPASLRGVLAKQYLALGDKARAKAVAQQALKEDPKNVDAAQVLKQIP